MVVSVQLNLGIARRRSRTQSGAGELEFARWWRQHDVDGFGEGVKRVRHPRLGVVEYEHAAFNADSDPNLRLIVYTLVQRG